MSALDGNTWYQITESRVNYTSALFWKGTGSLVFENTDTTDAAMYWQIFHLAGGNFQFRSKSTNILQQLSVCYSASEASTNKTQLCMKVADETRAQKWKMSLWDDGTYKITNVENGTDLQMDWHPGGPGFMSPTIAETPLQPAQHWMFKSISAVEDGVYSTSVAALSTAAATTTGSSSKSTTTGASASAASASASSTGASPTGSTSTGAANSQKSSSSSGLSSGAAAGIGIGVAVLVIAIFVLAFLLLHRKKKQRNLGGGATELPATTAAGYSQQGKAYEKVVPVEAPGGHAPSYEMYTTPSELPDTSTAAQHYNRK